MDRWLLRGGSVHDGLGGEPKSADVLLADGRIEAVGAELEARDVAILDVRGLAVAPGFIDLHSHSDLILVLEPEKRRKLQRGKLLQGITTEIAGNCGLGAAPLSEASAAPLRAVLSWMTPEGTRWDWKDFEDYLARVASTPQSMNVGLLAAHGAVRAEAIGFRSGSVDASDLRRMSHHVSRVLDAGAFGLSSGLIYPPGLYADTDELAAVAEPLSRAGGVFTCHVRGSSETLLPATRELLEIGRRAGCAVHHSHSEAVGPAHWDKIGEVLAEEEETRRAGVRVSFDLFPYHAAATMMSAIYPPWALDGGPAALLERLKDRAARARIRMLVETEAPAWPPWRAGGWPHNLVLACGYGRIFVSRTGGATSGRYDGLSLQELGRARGCDPFEAISDLMIEEGGEVGQWIFGISGEEGRDAPLAALLASPFGAIATDACDYGRGLPHPAAYGTFPRILGRFVRERRLLTLPEAIRKMTSLPASILGLTDRGRIAAGAAADIVVFDADSIADHARFELPRREATGVRELFVNGRLAVHGGEPTGIDGGVLLRRG